MSGYYPPNQQYPPQYYNINPNAVPDPNMVNGLPMMPGDVSMPHGLPDPALYQPMPGSFVSYGEPHMQQPYMGPYEDVPPPMDPAAAAGGRMRRRPAPGDQVKHRRTRSGCFTCRNRRVKVISVLRSVMSEHFTKWDRSAMRHIPSAKVSLALRLSHLFRLTSWSCRMSQRQPRMRVS
jgi:hypothetical protein